MDIRTNWQRVGWVTVLTVITVLLGAAILWLMWDIMLEFRQITLAVLVTLFLVFGGWLVNLASPGHNTRYVAYNNASIEPRAIPINYGVGSQGNLFMSTVRSIMEPDEFHYQPSYPVELPNGVVIGNQRLVSIVYTMGMTGETSRRYWRGRVTDLEWDGVRTWLLQNGLLERQDGRGKIVIRRPGEGELPIWWDNVQRIVERSKA